MFCNQTIVLVVAVLFFFSLSKAVGEKKGKKFGEVVCIYITYIQIVSNKWCQILQSVELMDISLPEVVVFP